MHVRPQLGQDIGRPIPAEGRFDHNLRFGARGCHRLSQRQRVVVDVDLREDLALGVLADDHRTAPVQVDTHILSIHGNLLSS